MTVMMHEHEALVRSRIVLIPDYATEDTKETTTTENRDSLFATHSSLF